ncbi:hypothetical protein C5167_000836 [Papaver somniferum]|uniref:BTB domain-containing protein n=1 Tax=Papaver somniferum TaxID=3469 RepID=A0A4Y7KWN5_PAPSO|nr:hypothetical protein C5167_000836 [Papaver somniferum]
MLESDSCKAAQGDCISLPEFNYEKLETFLEFLYRGDLAIEKSRVSGKKRREEDRDREIDPVRSRTLSSSMVVYGGARVVGKELFFFAKTKSYLVYESYLDGLWMGSMERDFRVSVIGGKHRDIYLMDCKAGTSGTILVLEDNPFINFVELPDTCQGLYYCNVLSGVIRGALETVSMKTEVSWVPDMLRGDDAYESRVKLLKQVPEEYTYKDDEYFLTVYIKISDAVSNETLKLAALKLIVLQYKHIVLLPSFDEFAKLNPHLVVQITRASLTYSNEKRI